MLSNLGILIGSKDSNSILGWNEYAKNILEKLHFPLFSIQNINEHLLRRGNFKLLQLNFSSLSLENEAAFSIFLLCSQEQIALLDKNIYPLLPPTKDEEFIKSIPATLFEEIFIVDKEGSIVFVNEAAREHYGMEVSELMGKSVYYFRNKGVWEPAIFPIILSERKRVTLLQYTSLGKKLLVNAEPIFNLDGEMILVLESAQDITQTDSFSYLLKKGQREKVRIYQSLGETYNKNSELIAENNGFIVHAPAMEEIVKTSRRVALTDSSILILGETGVGKTHLAKLIHHYSRRAKGPFITLNCAAIPEQLFESELFGYSPGAFTGANKGGKIGLIELANGGTLFLDEIAEISLQMQSKLLQVIEERQFINIGGKTPKKVDLRIITATNRNIKKLVRSGSFRQDLYYRLNTIEIFIPPLRKRPEDLAHLMEYFLDVHNKKYGSSKRFSSEAQNLMMAYSWPGNIRELSHFLERLIITVPENIIRPKHLSSLFSTVEEEEEVFTSELMPLDHALERVEKQLVTTAFRKFKSSYKVAEALNISQSKAYRLMRKFKCYDSPSFSPLEEGENHKNAL